MNLECWKLHKEFSLHEAACLIGGIDPDDLQDTCGLSYYGPDAALVSAIQKATRAGDLKGFVRVKDSAEWWVTELIGISSFEESDWCNVVFHKNDLVEWLRPTGLRPALFFPDESNDKADSTDQACMTPSKPIDPRKEATLNCLIAVLAKKLNYSPDDKNTVGKVHYLLELEGVSMDKKTIRTNIKTAFEALNNKRE